MNRFVLVFTAAVAIAATPSSAASLRNQVLIDGDVIRLGDIFEGAGPRADAAVVQAPAPGRRISYDANWLGEVARLYQVAWRPQSRLDRVTIERAGRTITTAELVAALKPSLVAGGMNPDWAIELAERGSDIAVALDTPVQIEMRNLSYDKTSGRFSSSLIVGGDHPSAIRVAAVGRIHPTVAVPVLRRAVSPGEVIQEDDIEWTHRREDQTRRDAIVDTRRLVGTTPRTRLSAGQPIRDGETRPPVVVARNATVTIVLQLGNMMLTAQGRANEDAARGETVRVTNLQSNKVIEAVVTSPDRVVVQLGARTAAIN